MIFRKTIIGIVFSLIIVFVISGVGCSSSKTTDSESSEDLPTEEALPDQEAKTDEVPVTDLGHEAKDAPAVDQPIASTDTPQEQVTGAAKPPADTAQAKITEPSYSGSAEDYTVQEGDTLMSIAFETYGDLYQWKKIYEDNKDKISNPNSIAKGTVLKVEKPSTAVAIDRNGDKYLIKRGDTLGTISDDVYGTNKKWKRLWENNKQMIHDPNRIFAGFHLYYAMTDEDRQEAEKLKQNRPTKPAPMAGAQDNAQPPAAAVSPAEAAPSASAQPSDAGGQAQAPTPLVQMDNTSASSAPADSGARGPASGGGDGN